MFRTPVLIAAALAFAFGVGYLFLAVRGCSTNESTGGDSAQITRPNPDVAGRLTHDAAQSLVNV